MLAFTRLDNTREAFPSPSIVTKRESTRYHEATNNVFHRPVTHVSVFCADHTRPLPQIPEHCLPTKYARVSSCTRRDVVMLFCPSFTQSERFLQTDQLITRLQVVVMTNFIRTLMSDVIVNVFMSGAVIWWAAIFRTPHRTSTNCCICQSPKALR